MPIRSVDSVRIWLVLTHERLGSLAVVSSSVSGYPALGSWLVSATAITVPERSLNTSWLRIKIGRSPACSWPRTGLRSAQRISPLRYLGPCLTCGRETFLRQSAFFRGVEFRGLFRQSCARQPGQLLGERRFHRLAPVSKALFGDESVDAVEEVGVDGERHFGFRHSMINHHTTCHAVQRALQASVAGPGEWSNGDEHQTSGA